MVRRKAILIGAVLVAIVGPAAIYWFGPQHLFINQRVDEALPSANVDEGRGSNPGEAGGVIGRAGDEDPVAAGPTILSAGEFRSLEHETSGEVLVVELGDGTRFLRLEGLDTLSGPDLRVYLSEAPADGPAGAFDDAFVDLGGLTANQGNQNYEIPRGVDLQDIESASVWCRRFSVGFGVAPLVPTP